MSDGTIEALRRSVVEATMRADISAMYLELFAGHVRFDGDFWLGWREARSRAVAAGDIPLDDGHGVRALEARHAVMQERARARLEGRQ